MEQQTIDVPVQLAQFLRGEPVAVTERDAEVLFATGAMHYQAERYSDAAHLFRALVLARPRSSRAWASLAMCHDALEDFERAAALYALAVDCPVDDGYRTRALVYLARTLFWLEHHEESVACLTRIGDAELGSELQELRDELEAEHDSRKNRRGR